MPPPLAVKKIKENQSIKRIRRKKMEEQVLNNFNQYLQNIGYSAATQKQVQQCIAEFAQQVNKALHQIQAADILKFYDYLQWRPLKRGIGALSPSMLQFHVFSLRVFFNWLEQSALIVFNPISNLKFKRLPRVQREPLTQQEIKQLFAACTSIKETAILHLFYSCGLRRNEAVKLCLGDIHFRKNMLYVREGKGSKRRAIPLTEKVKQTFIQYYEQERGNSTETAFILGTRGKAMNGGAYNKTLKKLIAQTAINPLASLHHLRHSIATHLLENGLGIEFIKDFLGHSHLESTQIYTAVSSSLLNKTIDTKQQE